MHKLEKTERNNEIKSLCEQGLTLEEIGKIVGLSKQRVCQINNKGKSKEDIYRKRKGTMYFEKIRFQGIYELFKNDYTMSYYKFAFVVVKDRASQRNVAEKWRKLLTGYTNEIEIRISWINNLIEYSGMTYEYLFKPREVTDNDT